MNPYLEKLKAYVETHPIQFDDDCDFPVLDSLYWHYSECHNMSNEKTKQASADLNACLDNLSLKDNDQVFCLVGALCAEHERIAFQAGLQLGAQLMLELQQGAESDSHCCETKRSHRNVPADHGNDDTHKARK